MGKYKNKLNLETENSTYSKILKQIVPGTKILEFGPAEGALTQYLHDELHCHVYIVEIDEDSFQKAALYAEGGVCGDIEAYEWESQFSDDVFDYILFADVLEHLRFPEEVLKRAGRLLKDSGKLVVSLPNIAHNDILLNLYDNTFQYTDIGLLDNTHIRFFAYRNLNELFAKADFTIVKEDYTRVQTFRSEQNVENHNFGGFVEETFFARPCGEIFQFILTAQKAQYVAKQGIATERPIQEMMDASSVRKQPNYYLEVQNLRQEVKNKESHIELLLRSERDLQTAIRAGKHENAENLRLLRDESMRAFQALKKESDVAYSTLRKEYEDAKEAADASYRTLKARAEAEKAEADAAYRTLKMQAEAEKAEADATYCALKDKSDTAYGNFLEEIRQLKDEHTAATATLQQVLRNKEGHIALLLESDRELDRIKNSRSWRFMGHVWKLRDMLIPKGSKRRLMGKLCIKFVKHPIQFLKKCTPTRIRKFFKLVRREGAANTSLRLDEVFTESEINAVPVVVEAIPAAAGSDSVNVVANYIPLHVPHWETPVVSIVIPVYNQFDYTYLCVKSILENSGSVSYEILIADDCSTDLTTQIDDVIHGLHTIHNEKNLRFLLNCNNAARYVKGQYILFLNNDTQVQENWLAPLVELIERDETIGMVGSKLIYPDGRLQEAGGILWKDGSAWNFGHNSDPNLPEYNYVKEVDYISGAAIMIRKSLWEEIGGFDETFVPAYYEDTDLAFEVRRHGYKVMYQPLSRVVHFEGASNGTDTSSGQKAYQVTNQKKFFEKWKDILERDHFENAQNVFQARDRSGKKETVLVIDHYIPTYDKDAGSRSVDHYLRLLVDLGYNVKFLPDNFYHDVHYAERYEQMGIEILYGVYYRDYCKEFLLEHAGYFDYALLSRPHISIKYIDLFRNNTKAKIVYYVQDLHFLREEREYEVTGDPALLKSAKKVKEQEFYIMERSDVVFTLSQVEKEIIDRDIAPDRAVITPISYFDKFPEEPVALQGKKDIIFVGGFGHHPNEDGVLWFVENVWNRVHCAVPEYRLVIIGSKPTEKIQALQNDHIVVTGFVTDEELEQHYKDARVCVIPLRYGAGVKGKTIEAMYHRVPIVSTSVGIEGLEGITKYITPVDTVKSFAKKVIRFCKDEELAEKEAALYSEYLQDHLSYESAKAIFARVFRKED